MGNLSNIINTVRFICLAGIAVFGLAAISGRAAASCSDDDPCGFGKVCYNDECVDSGSVDCASHSEKECYDNDVYWYDSCGGRQEKLKECGQDSYLAEYQCSSSMVQQSVIARGCDKGECQEVKGWIDLQNCADKGLACRDGVCRTEDATPPLLYSLLPSGEVNTSRVVLSLTTNEAAECRYSYYDVSYEQMGMKFAAGDGVHHSAGANLAAPGDYIFYVRCRNGAGNVNLVSSKISFSYATGSKKINSGETRTAVRDSAPPAILTSSLQPSGRVNSDTVELSLATDEKANCRYDVNNSAYASMANDFERDTAGTAHHKAVTLPGSGSYAYYVRCRDTVGNENSSAAVIEFEYGGDSAAGLVISGLNPAGVIYQKTVALEAVTDITAKCRYSPSKTDFDLMENTFSTTNGLQHLAVANLEDYGDYSYNVACIGDYAREKSGAAQIFFQYKDLNGADVAAPETVKCDNAVSGKGDGVCDVAADCECDPDCDGRDSDCAKVQDHKEGGIPVWGVVLTAIAVVSAGVYLMGKRTRERSDDSGEDDSLGL